MTLNNDPSIIVRNILREYEKLQQSCTNTLMFWRKYNLDIKKIRQLYDNKDYTSALTALIEHAVGRTVGATGDRTLRLLLPYLDKADHNEIRRLKKFNFYNHETIKNSPIFARGINPVADIETIKKKMIEKQTKISEQNPESSDHHNTQLGNTSN